METSSLIGRVAAAYIKEQVPAVADGSTARFVLDCLQDRDLAAIATAILNDEYLRSVVDLKLPIGRLAGFGLPDDILTNHRATYFRNASCAKPVQVLANAGGDEAQSMSDITPIGVRQLLNNPGLWVEALKPTDASSAWETQQAYWKAALDGLLRAEPALSLHQFAEYAIGTYRATIDGRPLKQALGFALPALRAPSDAAFFESIPEARLKSASAWRRGYEQAIRKRGYLLQKKLPTGAELPASVFERKWKDVQAQIPKELHNTVESFVAAEPGWNQEAIALAKCKWDDIKALFEDIKKEKLKLGERTRQFYADHAPDLFLTPDHERYLDSLAKRNPREADEDDEDFFDAHRDELKLDKKLRADWEKFIYGGPVESGDFLVGLCLCLEPLFRVAAGSYRRIVITSETRSEAELRRSLNVDAGRFFALRYRGLRGLFGSHVQWEVGSLFEFDDLVEKWRSDGSKKTPNTSKSRAALQVKFYISFDYGSSPSDFRTEHKQLIWRFEPDGVAAEFASDVERLSKAHNKGSAGCPCSAYRENVSDKGQWQSLDLRNNHTLQPSFAKDRGSFVPSDPQRDDLFSEWRKNLERSQLADETKSVLLNAFELFATAYQTAIDEILGRDFSWSSPQLKIQAELYAKLISLVCDRAKGDRNRLNLLRPLYQLGVVEVLGGDPAAIIAPWHPLRLQGLATKARIVAQLIEALAAAVDVPMADARMYFRELERELSHPFYPELAVAWILDEPKVLSMSDYYLDYSLHELPIKDPRSRGEVNEDPSEAASLISDILRRYIQLYPHERANLSVVLYNCDSVRLPEELVGRLAELYDDESVRCQVVLKHRDARKLRALYQEIMHTASADTESVISSEVSTDFMAQLRIGIMAAAGPRIEDDEVPPADVVFLQDVIARNSVLEWYKDSGATNADDLVVPPRWTRRRPSASDDLKSVAYLCSPEQPATSWSYLKGLSTFWTGDLDGKSVDTLLPCRQINYSDHETATVIREVHKLGCWVANFDDLVDRRQLEKQDIKVIKYKQTTTLGRNLVVSSNCSLSFLQRMVAQKLSELNLDLPAEQLGELARSFVQRANQISGDVVLRAAKKGRSASELIGLVLSQFLVASQLPQDANFGVYFLDDYAEWLGQREQQIADIMVLHPEQDSSGRLKLSIIISEAKYISHDGLSSEAKKSFKQLRDTASRMASVLFHEPCPIDRDMWLARLSDLLLSGVRFSANSNLDLSAWRQALRSGNCEISVSGFSHVFVSGPSDCPDCSRVTTSGDNLYQEVYSRADVRDLVTSYQRGRDPGVVRARVSDGRNHWSRPAYRELPPPSTAFKQGKLARENQPLSLNTSNEVAVPPGGGQNAPSAKVDEADNTLAGAERKWSRIQALMQEEPDDGEARKKAEEWLAATAKGCSRALVDFDLQATLLEQRLTPNAALLKYEGSSYLTVEQVLKKRSQFLTTYRLNVLSVVAEPGRVVICIARPSREVLTLGALWRRWQPESVECNTELVIGQREDDGELLFLSPQTNAPHTLIAGSTGSGKSVLMQSLILSIAATNSARTCEIVLIDPKMGVDYFAFEPLPHLKHGIIDSQEVAVTKLNELAEEMDRRYAMFKHQRVSNIFQFNAAVPTEEQLPYLWVIHDEFAEWMLMEEYKKNVEAVVGRLGTKARAAGISLIFAAQRPDNVVFPMQLRSNLGNRLILRVDSEGTSEISLGEKGAERLLGKGHLAAKLDGLPALTFAQVPLIDAKVLKAIVGVIVEESMQPVEVAD